MFSHLWIRQNKEQNHWNLACDIAVEYTIDHLNKPCTKRILSLIRKETYEKLEKDVQYISAPAIYSWLFEQDNIHELVYEFFTDDHRYWPQKKTVKLICPIIPYKIPGRKLLVKLCLIK